MKKYILILTALVAVISCRTLKNDLVPEEVLAEITEFKVVGQVSSTISKATRTVTVTLPKGTDMSKLQLESISYTEGAVCLPYYVVGDELNLTQPIKITLTNYDVYVWTVTAVEDSSVKPEPEGPQLYNMGLDRWCKVKDKTYGSTYDALYDEDATEAEKAIWASASASTELLGYHTVVMEENFLAMSGENKRALKLQTQGIDALFGMVKKLAAGSVFTGKTGKIDIAKMSASIHWGVPFTDRPKALEGFYCYKPVAIDWVQDAYKELKGTMDKGSVAVMLADWDEPFEVNPPDKLLDPEKDPGIIGYGKILFDKNMTAYEPFHVDITYRSDRTPKYIAIVCSSSYMGDYFTGGSGSVLYLDEFKLLY